MNELVNWEVLWLINGNMQILTYFVAFIVCFSFLSLIGLMDHLFDKKQTQ